MQINELLDAKLLERHKSQQKRNYLGASILGDECIRKIQLQYMKHDVKPPYFVPFDSRHFV